MKLTKYVQQIGVGLATLGLLVSNPSFAGDTARPLPAKPAIVDVSLAGTGVLQGQVISPQGHAIANAPIVLQQGKNEVAKTKTDQHGRFAVHGLKGGVYVVSTDGAASVVRAWSPRTAPPSAIAAVLLVPETATTRANLDDGMATNLGIGALVVGGVVATVLVVSMDHNSSS